MAKSISCPKCKSVDCQPLGGSSSKRGSVTKAVTAAALTGGLSLLAGVGKKSISADFICNKCSNMFTVTQSKW